MNLYFLSLLILLFFLFILVLTPSKHKKNISKAQRVLYTIRSIQGEYHQAKIFTYLRKISPYVFEELLLTVFEEKGFEIRRNKRYSHDGGIDGKVYKNGEQYIIQAKRYKGHIKPEHLKEFQICITRFKAKGGFFIHTGRTGKEHFANFRHSNIEILSGNRLIQFLLEKSN